MSTYWRVVVLLSVVLMAVIGASGGDEVETLSEKQLESFVDKTDFVLVLYCKYF